MVNGGDTQIINTVVQQYNGTMGAAGGITGKSEVTRGVAMMDTDMAAAAGPDRGSSQTTVGETDVGLTGDATDELDRTRNP
jgi:hypothetical protein